VSQTTYSRLSISLVAVLITCVGALASQSSIHLKAGQKILLELDTPLNSATARIGDEVWFTARNDLYVNGQLAIPRGAPFRGSVIDVKPAMLNGKYRRAQIQIRLETMPLAEGGSHAITSEVFKVDAEKSGSAVAGAAGQASQGAIYGGMISRSGKGAAIGAAAGVGVGILVEKLKTKGPTADVDLPYGSVFEAKLERPLDISDPAMLAKAVPRPAALPLPVNVNNGAPQPVIDVAAVNPPQTQPVFVPQLEPIPPAASAAPLPVESVSTPADLPTLKVDVNLVNIDAIVRDRSGKPMANLRKEDFRVFEDGVEQPIQFFSRDPLPMAVAIVIDRSGSVAPLMGQIQSAAYDALQLLKAGDEVCLFTFAGSVQQLEELTPNRQRIANRIGSIKAGGGTAILDALTDALRYLNAAAPDKRRAIILISDNMEGRSMANKDYAVQLALETEASIYSVKVGNGSGGTLMGLPGVPGIPMPRLPGLGAGDPVHDVVKETGGEIFEVTVGSPMNDALRTAVDRLKMRYTIGYPSSKGGAARAEKGGYHRIEVQLDGRFGKPDVNYTVHARSGYYDPKK
jgi:Ca-activated chloride channel family protein